MVPIDKVKDIINKYDALEKELSLGNMDPKLYVKKSKEYSSLGGIIKTAREYLNFEREKKDLVNLAQDKSNDKDMIELAQKDLDEIETSENKIHKRGVKIHSFDLEELPVEVEELKKIQKS